METGNKCKRPEDADVIGGVKGEKAAGYYCEPEERK